MEVDFQPIQKGSPTQPTKTHTLVIYLELGTRGDEHESLRMFFLMAFGWF